MSPACDRPLSSFYDVAVLDLDGVVYIGAHAVPGAVPALAAARAAGMKLAFVTNNASRPPGSVAEHLGELGIQAEADDVVTSAQAAARLLGRTLPAGALVYVIGGEGLEVALRERDLVPVTAVEEGIAGVAQGFGPEMPWRRVIDGALLVRQGLPWVASNTDLTVPTPHGPGPGNGTLVRLVAEFAGREPEVAGKPQPPLFEETLERVGGRRPLVVGDRIDTDIEGAIAVGWDSLLVMTGVTTISDLATLVEGTRPTYVAADLSALGQQLAPVVAGEANAGGWHAEVSGGDLVVSGSGDPNAWWHVVAAALWGHLDTQGRAASVTDAVPGSVLP